MFVAKARKHVFGENETFHQVAVLDGEGSGQAGTLVVGKDVGLVDVEEVQDGFEVARGGFGREVVVGGDGGITTATVVCGDDGVVLGQDGADRVPC